VSVALPAEARRFQGSRAGIVSRSVAAVIDFGVAVVAAFVLVLIRSVWSFFTSGGTSLRIEWPSRLGLSSLVWVVLFLYLAWGWAGPARRWQAGARSDGRHGGRRLPRLAIAARCSRGVPRRPAVGAVSARQRSVQDLLLARRSYDWRRSRRRQPESTNTMRRSAPLVPRVLWLRRVPRSERPCP
jgi:hypothetical protein